MSAAVRSGSANIIHRLDSMSVAAWFSRLAIAVGVLLRVIQFLHNRPLWIDEVALTANLLSRDYSGLLQRLDHDQGAPVGFLFIQRTIINLLGDSEYALRLFPLLAGIAALFLFYWIARHTLSKGAIPLALGLFVLSDRLIYYSSEVKQYSSDVLIILLITAFALRWLDAPLTGWRWTVMALGGAVLLWFAHPAAFALAGIGLSLFLYSLVTRRPGITWRLVGVGVVWGISLGMNYFVSLRNLAANPYLLSYWDKGFMPRSFGALLWFNDTFFNVLEDPLMLTRTGVAVAALALVTGGVALYNRRRISFFILVSPLLLTLVASALHVYPYAGRLILFLVPCYLLFIGEGTEQIRAALWNASKSAPGRRAALATASIVLLLLLFFPPIKDALSHLSYPSAPMPDTTFGLEDIRSVTQYLVDNRQPGDFIYEYYGSDQLNYYYAKRFGLKPDELYFGVSARSNWQAYFDELDTLRGRKRVWFIFSHIWHETIDERILFLQHLDQIGTQLDAFTADGAAVYLYDLSQPPG